MSFTYTFDTNLRASSGTLASSVSYNNTGTVEVNEIIAAGVNQQIDIAFSVNPLSLDVFYLLSTLPINVFTNSADGTGGDSFAVAANVPLVWTRDAQTALFSQDVAAMWIDNGANTAEADVRIRVLNDATQP